MSLSQQRCFFLYKPCKTILQYVNVISTRVGVLRSLATCKLSIQLWSEAFNGNLCMQLFTVPTQYFWRMFSVPQHWIKLDLLDLMWLLHSLVKTDLSKIISGKAGYVAIIIFHLFQMVKEGTRVLHLPWALFYLVTTAHISQSQVLLNHIKWVLKSSRKSREKEAVQCWQLLWRAEF